MKIITRSSLRRTLFLLVALSVAMSGYAKKPDFSGTWKLNKSASTLNAEFSFAPHTITITQDKNSLTSERVSNFQGNEFTMKDTYTLDGEKSINEGWQGSEVVSIAAWKEDKKSLGVATTIEMMDGGELVIDATYKLDGKQLVIVNEMKGGPMGGSSETWVYDKQ
jgi:hypothetical protein